MEIETNTDKEVKEKVKSEVTEETPKKNQLSKSALKGLIISGIGGVLYFFNAIVGIGQLNDFVFIPSLIGAVMSGIGILIVIIPIIGRNRTKIGGLILLLSLTIASIVFFVLYNRMYSFLVEQELPISYSLSYITIWPMVGIGALVMIGAILLIASKSS